MYASRLGGAGGVDSGDGDGAGKDRAGCELLDQASTYVVHPLRWTRGWADVFR